MIDRETETVGLGQQITIVAFEFRDPIAVTTNQKLRAAVVAGMNTGNERVAALDAVNQAFAQQKLERTVNDRRRNTLFVIAPIQLGEYVVSAHRLMAGEQYLENLPTA